MSKKYHEAYDVHAGGIVVKYSPELVRRGLDREWYFGFKVPSSYTIGATGRSDFTIGQIVNRAKGRGQPVACSECAVHLAAHTRFDAGINIAQHYSLYVGMMNAYGMDGNHMYNLKAYGKRYQIVAKIKLPMPAMCYGRGTLLSLIGA